MAARTITGGFETYQRASDGQWGHGMFGEEVDVHEDDLERFDRLHPADVVVETAAAEEADDVDIPEGDPTEEWTAKQLDAYALAKDIDLGGAKNKAEKVAAITAATSA